jgi:hypothetical protein
VDSVHAKSCFNLDPIIPASCFQHHSCLKYPENPRDRSVCVYENSCAYMTCKIYGFLHRRADPALLARRSIFCRIVEPCQTPVNPLANAYSAFNRPHLKTTACRDDKLMRLWSSSLGSFRRHAPAVRALVLSAIRPPPARSVETLWHPKAHTHRWPLMAHRALLTSRSPLNHTQ